MSSEAWVTAAQAGAIIGGLGGGGIGLLGALVGTLMGVLIPRGKGRGLVMGVLWAGVAIGVGLLGFGLVALVAGQPGYVWIGPLAMGAWAAGLFGFFVPMSRRMYAMHDARRLAAEEFRRA